MDNKLVIQLLKSKTEEIQNLLEHFANKPEDLNDGIELLDSRILGLSQDFKILKKNCELKPAETVSTNVPEEIISASPEPIKEEIEFPDANFEKPQVIDNVDPEKPEIEEKEQIKISIVKQSAQSEPIQLIGEKLSSQKLKDIQSAIGINDRFLFARELFENNIDEYNTAISFVNKAGTFESVMNWIKAEKEWDLEDPTVTQFIEITKRKF
ncbi:hypothetical protein QUH73_17805 [Labilibaculum sp. K2S]|uniref:hypothetical protein n=1 Tax=Labilibaculum sp. K2S TaxID=3056386 RepID=UPI0025A3C328|nr:hypothetical protein [Labilibaculum sp. K2S]MDM8161676.1 hypothetical protein [Labilibaculum sp. K2S]